MFYRYACLLKRGIRGNGYASIQQSNWSRGYPPFLRFMWPGALRTSCRWEVSTIWSRCSFGYLTFHCGNNRIENNGSWSGPCKKSSFRTSGAVNEAKMKMSINHGVTLVHRCGPVIDNAGLIHTTADRWRCNHWVQSCQGEEGRKVSRCLVLWQKFCPLETVHDRIKHEWGSKRWLYDRLGQKNEPPICRPVSAE